MNLNLKGKCALVCGSSQGMGKAIAIQLSKQGANVVLFARNQSSLQKVLQELDTSQGQSHDILIADFSNPSEVKQNLKDYLESKIIFEILINNTGGPKPGPAFKADSDHFTTAFDQHLINNHQMMQLLLPGMQQSKFGRIINVISTSVKQPLMNLGVSNTVRGAVANWAKTLANELGQYNITVNNVLPGATNTARLDAIIQNKANKNQTSFEEMEKREKAIIPMQRFGTPEEFADAVGFLCSPSASYITGINLPVDGGRTSSL